MDPQIRESGDDELARIVRLSVEIDTGASGIYETLTQAETNGDIREAWAAMARHQQARLHNGRCLIGLVETGVLGAVFEHPEAVREELVHINLAVLTLGRLARSVRNTTEAFLLACRVECGLLHPAFASLHDVVKAHSKDAVTDEPREESLIGLIDGLRPHVVWTPEVELLCEVLRRMWKVNAQLAVQLAKVRTLSGLLPICASCKRIRGRQGEWIQIEQYVSSRTEAQFSHGICPECTRKLYPDLCHGVLEQAEGGGPRDSGEGGG